MKFNFWFRQHGPASRETLMDMVGPMQVALRAMGHEAISNDHFRPGWVTVIPEYFPTQLALEIIRHEPKLDFGILCTEWFDGVKIVGQDHDPDRTSGFLALAQHARFIWSLVDESGYRRFGRPYAHTPIRWEPDLYVRNDRVPARDLVAFGPITESRAELQRKMHRDNIDCLWVPFGTPRLERDALIGDGRYVLGLPATGNQNEVSQTRISAAMHADRAILPAAELAVLPDIRDNWDSQRVAQLRDYAAAGTMRDVMKAALEIL